MSNVRQLLDNGVPIYPITDKTLVLGLNDVPFEFYVVAWDGASTPVAANIPAGVSITYDGNTYTGSLAASSATAPYLYLVASTSQQGEYDRYITTHTGSTYAWTALGSTAPVSPVIADNLTTNDASKALSAKQGKILGEEVSELEAKVTGSRQNYSSGYLDSDGVVNQYAPWLHSVDYIPVSTGDTVYWNPGEVFGSAALVFYDENKVKIGYRGANAVERTVTITEQGAAYARLSFAVSNKNNACLKVNGNTVWTANEEIFGVEDLIDETEERLEGQITGQSINYQNNRIIDSSGVIYPMSGWIASTDYTPVAPGDVLLWYPNAINGSAALAIYDSNLNLLQWKGANATQREIIVPDGGAFIRASFSSANKSNAIVKNGTTTIWKPKDDILGLEDINYFIGCVTDSYGGVSNAITVNNNKVSINSTGIRVNFRGKQLILAGPFDMPYDSSNAPNGAWVIDVKTLSDAVDGSTINLTSSIVKYVASDSEQIKKDVILFTCYFGRIFPVGLFGTTIAKKESLVSLNKVSIIAIDALNSSRGNVVLDADNKTVTIKKEGVRLKLSDKFLILSGSADFVMAYDSTDHPNGGWFLKTSAVQSATDGENITLSSDNIVYYSIGTSGYNDNILLFACYFNTLIASGILGGCLLQRQIDAINIDNPSVEINEAKCKQFAAYFNNSGICETFAFMTDPHLLGLSNSFDEVQFAQYIHTLGRYYDNTPVDWCICGGDWLNNSDYQDIACWKLGYMDATMRKSFKHYFPVLGNHDTNYQGVVSSEDSSRGDLTHQTLVNLMFRENGNTYYKFKGNNTQFYVFDTGTDWEDWMTAFKWEQIDWFAKALIADDAEHTVIIQHIYYSSGTTVNNMASNIQAVAGAYNSRTTLTLNGITYDFSGCTGKIACVIAGHSHYDDIITENVSVPVWLTTNMMDGSTPTFDLCVIDYTAGKMKSVRIGTGNNREMTLA